MRSLFVVLMGLLCILPVQALDQYAGIGSYNNGLFVHYQLGNQYGNIELRAGQFFQMNNNIDVNLSVRRYIEQDANIDGFFVGGFAGQVNVSQIDVKQYRDVGAGFEMGYQWVSKYTKTEFYGGMGINRALSYGAVTQKAQPAFLLGLSIGLDLHALHKR